MINIFTLSVDILLIIYLSNKDNKIKKTISLVFGKRKRTAQDTESVRVQSLETTNDFLLFADNISLDKIDNLNG